MKYMLLNVTDFVCTVLFLFFFCEMYKEKGRERRRGHSKKQKLQLSGSYSRSKLFKKVVTRVIMKISTRSITGKR